MASHRTLDQEWGKHRAAQIREHFSRFLQGWNYQTVKDRREMLESVVTNKIARRHANKEWSEIPHDIQDKLWALTTQN